ncbi:MAG: SCO family protein [Planctomycetota bacterium]|nr:MAG: SCO family protein [Planctomycetota bacterium]
MKLQKHFQPWTFPFFFIYALLGSLLFLASCQQSKQPTSVKVGFEKKLGQTIPLDMKFYDEDGKTVSLSQLVDRPTFLALVYYRCPGICTPLLNGVKKVIEKVDLEPYKDFQILTISFDPTETPKIAKQKKNNYLKALKRKIPPQTWRFLTGDAENIRKITEAVGFRYQPDKGGFRHPGALILLSEKGKIIRYLEGIEYLPFDFQMAVLEAHKGISSPSRLGTGKSLILRFCYSYDPEGKTYALNFTNIGMAVIFFMVSIFAIFLFLKTQKSDPSSLSDNSDNHSPKDNTP